MSLSTNEIEDFELYSKKLYFSALHIISTSASAKLFSAALGEGEPDICLISVVRGIQMTVTAYVPPETESLLRHLPRDLVNNRIRVWRAR